jgi:hypothetical protein
MELHLVRVVASDFRMQENPPTKLHKQAEIKPEKVSAFKDYPGQSFKSPLTCLNRTGN